jgi:hypothetical protein
MSIVVMLMIFGWSASIAMIGFYALKESGKLLEIRRRLALWLDNTLTPAVVGSEESPKHEGVDAA